MDGWNEADAVSSNHDYDDGQNEPHTNGDSCGNGNGNANTKSNAYIPKMFADLKLMAAE